MNKLRIRNAGETESQVPEILLYGDVGYEWDGFKAADVARCLQQLGKVDAICARINSMGGDVGEGLAIYNLLKSHGAAITTVNDGYALSSACTIFMAGDTRRMNAGSVLMMHKPSCFSYGDADVLRKEAGILDVLQAQIAGIYATTSGKTPDDCNALMNAETWLTGDQALEMTFATEAVGGPASPDGDTPDEGGEQIGNDDPAEPADDGDDESVGNHARARARFRNAPAKFFRLVKAGNQGDASKAWRREMAQRWLQLHAHL